VVRTGTGVPTPARSVDVVVVWAKVVGAERSKPTLEVGVGFDS
jgi:hypothetical protein